MIYSPLTEMHDSLEEEYSRLVDLGNRHEVPFDVSAVYVCFLALLHGG